jgi:hypothetical protein
MRRPSVAVRLLLCAALSCSAGPRGRAQSARSFSGNWDEKKAAEIALQISRSWLVATPGAPQNTPEKPMQSKAYAFLPFDKSGVTRWLVLVAQSQPDYTCHACAPATGGVIFTRKHDVFEADYDQPKIVSLGTFGNPPKAYVQDLSRGRPAIAFEINSLAQGYEATTLTLVAELGGKLKKVLSLQTAASNEAAGLPDDQTFKWHATLEFVPGSNPKYFDVRVKATGTSAAEDGPNAGKVRPRSLTVVYRFSDGAYKPETK